MGLGRVLWRLTALRLARVQAKFLLSRMDGLDLGLDYKTFANKVFGIMRNS